MRSVFRKRGKETICDFFVTGNSAAIKSIKKSFLLCTYECRDKSGPPWSAGQDSQAFLNRWIPSDTLISILFQKFLNGLGSIIAVVAIFRQQVLNTAKKEINQRPQVAKDILPPSNYFSSLSTRPALNEESKFSRFCHWYCNCKGRNNLGSLKRSREKREQAWQSQSSPGTNSCLSILARAQAIAHGALILIDKTNTLPSIYKIENSSPSKTEIQETSRLPHLLSSRFFCNVEPMKFKLHCQNGRACISTDGAPHLSSIWIDINFWISDEHKTVLWYQSSTQRRNQVHALFSVSQNAFSALNTQLCAELSDENHSQSLSCKTRYFITYPKGRQF